MKPARSSVERILEPLNPPQREAVLHERGPLLVLAGAGSGKTRVITHRIAMLLARGCAPESILAITFTNKAAAEMKARAECLCGIQSPWISTFHSFCARLLRRHIHRLAPYDNSFTIYDQEDSQALVKEVLRELAVDSDIWTPRAAQARVSRIKNAGRLSEGGGGSLFLRERIIREVYERYGELLRERNAVDFDDLLLLVVRLFEEAPDVLGRYQEEFRHVLIDEYQDTNGVQYQIGKRLTEAHRNICITGDPDQSIYSWRGADIGNILNFEADYPDARVVALEKNYRSTGNILRVANALISHNVKRLPKSLWTDGPAGEPARVYRFADERQEAEEIAELAGQLLSGGTPPGDIAIFYRINALSRAVEQALIQANIPYAIVGGIEFFLRKEVKDILAYLRILANPRDAESAKRVLNVPPRGIGKATVERLLERGRERAVSLLRVVLDPGEELPVGRRAASALEGFGALYRRLKERAAGPVGEAVRAVIEESGYEEYLRDSQSDAGLEQVSNIWELQHAAKDYDESEPGGGLTGFLERVNLLGDVDRWSRSEDRVTLMTLHSAKGLEFPVVVIVGLEDGILPLRHPDDDPGEDDEEERRLLYVGITRAKRHLYLTHTALRMRYGRPQRSVPSDFLEELRDEASAGEGVAEGLELDDATAQSLLDRAAGHELSPDEREADPSVAYEDRSLGVDVDPYAFGEGDEDPFPIGSRVVHEEYGVGEVTRISGVGRRRRITVAFEEGGEKQFVLGFGPLRRLR